MSSSIEIINPIGYPGWDEFVLSTRNYSFFHSSSWAKVLHESYGYRPLYFAFINNGTIAAVLPCMEIKSIVTGKRAVCLPFTDYCDPILGQGCTDEILNSLLNDLIKFGRMAAWKSVELRCGIYNGEPPTPSYACFGHVLETSNGEEAIFSSFRDSTKRNIKKAINEGVKVEILRSLESIRNFYDLNCITRKDHGLPPQPYRFFEKIYEHVLSKDRGFVVLSSYGDRYIAGAVYFHFGGVAIYKYGASDKNYQHVRANNLVMWEAVKWLTHNKFQRLSLGRTEPENKGLKRFKDGWGTDERIIRYYKYDMASDAFVDKPLQLTGFAKKIFSKLPQFLLRPTGSILYRHIG